MRGAGETGQTRYGRIEGETAEDEGGKMGDEAEGGDGRKRIY